MTSKPLIAAIEVGEFLSKNKIRYALIGGLAVIRNWLGQFSEVLGSPEVSDHFERIWEEYLKS